MIYRDIDDLIKEYRNEFRSLAVVGPRQSGKSTVVKQIFSDKPYVSLENPSERLIAENDTEAFLARFPKGAVIDEAQRVPKLFSFLQEILDNTQEDGLFILTGSNNFLLQDSISQTLAGRIGYIDLYPLSVAEVMRFGKSIDNVNELIFNGFYPELYDKNRKPTLWYPAYIRTYVERDVKLIRNIDNSLLFTKFLKLCAGRIGQIFNVNSLSVECGIDIKTVNAWLSILQSSYIIHLLPAYYNSFNKRLVKSPKLYFIDTGLACSLLDIKKQEELITYHARGSLFENFILMEMLKQSKNRGLNHHFYYWRDNNGVEIDIVLDKGNQLIPIEIKASQTYHKDFTKNLKKFNSYANLTKGKVVYEGSIEFTDSQGFEYINWRNMNIL